MEKKNFLSEDDVRHLTIEQRNAYDSFLSTIRDKGIFYHAQFEKFVEILEQQYRTGTLQDGAIMDRFPEILAENINSIINTITQVRNDVINEKRVFNDYQFGKIYEGLEELQKFVKGYAESRYNQGRIGTLDLKAILPRIEQLKNQISQDISFYQGYEKEKTTAISNYKFKKEAYDKLSLFGKLAARVNGQKKALQEAQRQNYYYNSARINSGIQQPGDIVNPYQYDEYLEKQQFEQSTGEMRR